MNDAVLGYHLNPITCGVAKFNAQLAARLDVPHDSLWTVHYQAPLVSIKAAEIGPHWWQLMPASPYDLLLHDRPEAVARVRPRRLFYADALGCPATIQGNPTRGAYKVLTFGMAHKLVLPHFEALKAQLEREHPDYTLSLSTAVHEGSPWDAALYEAIDGLRAIFGDRLRVLGFLGDDALAKELQECDAVAAFFDPALRANNTSAWAAVAAGKRLYTNTDEQSPRVDQPPTWEGLLEVLRGA